MGERIFGPWRRRIVFDDRTLTHVRIALRTRMKRGASFRLTWRLWHEGGFLSQGVLVHPGSLIDYRFDGPHLGAVNRICLRQLLAPTLGRDMVLSIEPEPAAEPAVLAAAAPGSARNDAS